LRICDRCGKKIEDGKEDLLKKLIYDVFARFLLADVNVDLCIECQREFYEKFHPKLEGLKEEVKEWLKKGEKK
jgi:DNA-directed RNA polymerase subunit RPC12/RpoP